MFYTLFEGGLLFSEVDDKKMHLVRTNEVAPIIIKNCKEEFQHVSEFKEPIVYGRIAENMPEHPLIKVSPAGRSNLMLHVCNMFILMPISHS